MYLHQLVTHVSFLDRVVAYMNLFSSPYRSGIGWLGPSTVKALIEVMWKMKINYLPSLKDRGNVEISHCLKEFKYKI